MKHILPDDIRHKVLEHLRTYKDTRTCEHDDLHQEVTCTSCAFEMGRRSGHVEAGAYWTLKEVIARLRSAIA